MNQRGFSFLECVVALGLIAALLGALAMILRSQFQLERALEGVSSQQETRQVLLRLGAEWKGCEKLIQPGVAQLTNSLVTERIAPDQESVRLPWPLPPLPISGWQPNNPSHRQQITYEVRQSRFVRAVGGEADLLLDQTVRVQFRQPTTGELRIQIDRLLAGKLHVEASLVTMR